MNALPLTLNRPAVRPLRPAPTPAAAAAPVTLARRELFEVQAPRGHRLACVRGSLWLTFEGCRADIVLEAGDSHHCQENGRLIVQALRDAVVELR